MTNKEIQFKKGIIYWCITDFDKGISFLNINVSWPVMRMKCEYKNDNFV